MKVLIFLWLLHPLAYADCSPSGGGKDLSFEEFTWNIGFPEVHQQADHLYGSSLRLKNRAYKVGSKTFLPIETPRGLVPVELRVEFLQRLTSQLETMIQNQYADVVTFADLGHSHFLIPEDYFAKEIDRIPPERIDEAYKKIFNHRDTLLLYHTGEQFQFFDDHGQLLPDKYLQWRFFTRNVVAENKSEGKVYPVPNLESKFNTLKGLPGYHFWGAGLYVSANKAGCFSYRHKTETRYFDINFSGL